MQKETSDEQVLDSFRLESSLSPMAYAAYWMSLVSIMSPRHFNFSTVLIPPAIYVDSQSFFVKLLILGRIRELHFEYIYYGWNRKRM